MQNKEKLGIFFCPTVRATEALASQIGRRLFSKDTVLLQGDLGTGKTTFARALIRSIAVSEDDVRSPTFSVVQEYEVTQGRLLHCDFYRLQGEKEVYDIGVEEALGHKIVLVEWADRAPQDFFPKGLLTIRFEVRPSGRLLFVSGVSSWRTRIESLALPGY